MITAHAEVLELPPGRYQILTVLKSVHKPIGCHRLGYRKGGRQPKDPNSNKYLTKHSRQMRKKLQQYLDSLPDDASELLIDNGV